MNKISLDSILNSIKIKKLEDLGPSNMTSGHKWNITLKRKHNLKTMSFEFHDNRYNTSDITSYLECLFIDRRCIISCPSIVDFSGCFGYDIEKGREVYREIRKNNRKLNNFFSRSEIEFLDKEFNY